jgi:hypothetical protein
MISHLAPSVENLENTVMNTIPQSQSLLLLPLSLSEALPSQPLALSVWQHLVSIMKKLRHWQVDLLLPLDKVVKILLQFCLPTPLKNRPPNGWVYVVEVIVGEVKQEMADLSLYNSIAHPLTHTQHNHLDAQKSDPYHHLCRATNTIGEPCIFPSTSSMSKESRHLLDMSKYTLMSPTPLQRHA